jgi:17beta-estradiol 17-dehydrogenase / very-long-chain 3-oxoacyl-CoA reductase
LVATVRWNALFSLQLIHALLPQLRASPGPVLVMNVGSYAGDLPPPRLAIYAASKRFMEFLSRGLSMDERYFTPTNVQFMYLSVGQVSTNAMRKARSFVCPDADTFAKAVVDRIGCGRRRIAPYVGHAITQWSVDMIGVDLGEMVVAQAMKQMFFSEGKKVD